MLDAIFLIGANGLVGSAFARYLHTNNIYFTPINRGDLPLFTGKECDLLINCNRNANKGQANANAQWDFEMSVASVAYYMQSIRAKKVVHISTVDVYSSPEDIETTIEDSSIDTTKLSVYGFHKYLAELYVKKFSDNYLIFRLPGLVGPGLKKNPIYDLLTPQKKLFVASTSRLNFIHTDDVAEIAMALYGKKVSNETFNLASSNSVRISDLSPLTSLPVEYNQDASANEQIYQINTNKLSQFIDRLPTSEESVLKYVSDVLSRQKTPQ